jgi:hypothetical protein
VKIDRDLLGNAGQNSGSVSAVTIAGVTIGGSILGGTANAAGQVDGDSSLGVVKIGHDVHGGSAIATGYIVSDGTISSVTIGGSLVGGTANLTGGIFPTELGPVKIGRDLVGGSLAPGAATIDRSGFIETQTRIVSVAIGGSIIAGLDDSAVGELVRNASIRAGDDLGSLSVKGSLIGNVSLNGTSPVIISARGQSSPVGDDMAIGRIAIGGSVERANLFAGYDTSLVPMNDGAQIAAVIVSHDWIASNLVAGTIAGIDGLFGTDDDAPIAGVNPLSRIASIIIKGQVFGTGAAGDHFGFVAREIGAAKITGQTLALTASVTDLPTALSPVTGDVRLREI